jgi:hypothetical protein
MGEEFVGIAQPGDGLRRQPAYGEYTEQPEVEAQHERSEEESPSDRFARRARWPVLFLLALIEVAWLVALVYLIHGLFLS